MTKFMMNRLTAQFDLHAALPYAAQLFIILSTMGIGALRRQGVKAQSGGYNGSSLSSADRRICIIPICSPNMLSIC